MDAGRREALKRIGRTVAAVGVAPLLSGCTGPVRTALLRVSYLAKYPDPVSLRMPVSRFVTGA